MITCKMRCEKALRKGKKLREGVLQVKEESGTVWLWRDPALLGWHKSIAWLFSPPHGGKGWKGDVWGIDSNGELIVVESKVVIKNKAGTQPKHCDPFRSLYVLHSKQRGKRDRFPVNKIREKWQKLHDLEGRVAVDCNYRGKRTQPGILPYGSYRHALKGWCKLYRAIRRTVKKNSSYSKRVVTRLKKRGHYKDRSVPYYFAFFTIGDDFKRPIALSELLSKKGKRHYDKLKKKVGKGHLLVAAACARANTHSRVTVRKVGIKVDL